MNIALDISPLSSGHKYRGTGFYVKRLLESLKDNYPSENFTFFTDKNEIPKNADIIHYPYFDPFSLTVPLENPKKTIISILDLTPILFPKHFPAGVKGKIKWLVQKNLIKRIGGIITISECSKKDIMNIVGINQDNVKVTYLAAGKEFKKLTNHQSQITSLRERYHLPEKFALYVGDVTWNKNVPRIIEATVKSKIPLVMIGKALVNKNFDRLNDWNKDLIISQKLAEENSSVIRLGFVSNEELNFIYNLASVFIMPSLYEGFGLPVLEAMQCGCPVITSREGSLREVAGEAAHFVDAYDTESIVNGVKEVFSSKKLQESLSKKGLEQASKFSWDNAASETMSIYKKIYSKNTKY